MFKKYARKINVDWITISGFVLIAVGTFLTYIGQNTSNRLDDKQLHQSISERLFQIDKLVKSKNKLLARIIDYQENLSERDKAIQRLKAYVDKINVPDPEKSIDKETETSSQVIPEKDFSIIIAQAKSLCDDGKYGEAYKIVDELRRSNPDFGQAYFILGTIQMRNKHYDEGEELLNHAVHLKLADVDRAWAFYNLGISSVRKMHFDKARGFIEKALELKPDMEESRKALKLIDDNLKKKQIIKQAKRLCVEGKNDEAYRIADKLRQEHPFFGSAYFMLGTIEMHREHYDKGEELLNQAIQLGLSDKDMAWAYHNLGYFSLQKQDFDKAKGLLEMAVEFNPDMEESKKALKLLGDLH